MAYGSGISASLGIASESTFGTGVTVSRFMEFNSESLEYKKKIAQSQGLRAGGRLGRTSKRVVVASEATGEITMDLPTKGLGLMLRHATGSNPTPTTVAAGVYSYAFTLGDSSGSSFTTQVGVPKLDGTILAKTFTGCKVASFDLEVSNDGIATGKFAIDARDMTTATALATPTYSATTGVFHFAQGAVTRNGTAVANIQDFAVSIDNSIKTDRHNLGSAGKKSEQIISGFRKASGKISAEFTDTNFLTDYLTDADVAIVLSFTGAVISGGFNESLTISIPAARLNSETPKVSGPDVVTQSIDFEILDNSSAEPITITFQTSDAAL